MIKVILLLFQNHFQFVNIYLRSRFIPSCKVYIYRFYWEIISYYPYVWLICLYFLILLWSRSFFLSARVYLSIFLPGAMFHINVVITYYVMIYCVISWSQCIYYTFQLDQMKTELSMERKYLTHKVGSDRCAELRTHEMCIRDRIYCG